MSQEWLDENCFSVGQLYYRYSNDAVAERYLNRYLETDRCVKAYEMVAEIKMKAGLFLEASEFYRQALALEPKEPLYYMKLIRTYEAMRRKVLGRGCRAVPG